MTERDLESLQAATFVRTIRHRPESVSTNTDALDWSRELGRRDLPALLLADRQTGGRGRGANRWWSAEGALTFSLLIEPLEHGVPMPQWPALSLTVGAAIAEALSGFAPGADVRLKWPNDVYIGGRKASGVLIESPPDASQRLVIGIGINVNNSPEHAPPEVRARAVSLAEVLGGPQPKLPVLQAVLQQLEVDLAALATKHPSLLGRWRRLCLLTGRSVLITDSGRATAGTCLGLDDDGALRVQTGHTIERLFSGVVTEFE